VSELGAAALSVRSSAGEITFCNSAVRRRILIPAINLGTRARTRSILFSRAAGEGMEGIGTLAALRASCRGRRTTDRDR